MGKEAKIKQTDWTRGGRDISNTAIPMYQQGLHQLNDYMGNVQHRLDPYLNNYFNPAMAAEKSDLMRDYYDAMGKATANNYSAMNGGYSSANQAGYDDKQRYYNDLTARLYSKGLDAANTMANNEYNMLQGALGSYHNAYGLGEAYSNIDQYNDMVDQANKNAWTGIVNTLGDVGLASGNPIGMAIGGVAKGVGTAFGKDFSAMQGLRAKATGVAGNQYSNNYSGLRNGLYNSLSNFDWYKENPFAKKGNSGGTNLTPKNIYSGYKGLGD